MRAINKHDDDGDDADVLFCSSTVLHLMVGHTHERIFSIYLCPLPF